MLTISTKGIVSISAKDKRDQVNQLKDKIRCSEYERFEDYDYFSPDRLVGTMFIVERMDYGFHIYYIHEPSQTNKIAGKDGIVTEMYYDLRNKIYWIKRNMKEAKFSERNVDCIFPTDGMKRKEVFEFLSTQGNKGMYESAFLYLGAKDKERVRKFGRFYRLITEYSYYELLYKSGIVADNRTMIVNSDGRNPADILGLSKTKWKILSKFNVPVSKLQEYRGDAETDRRLLNYLEYINSLEEEFGVNKIESFIRNEMQYIYTGASWGYRSSIKISKEFSLPEKRFIKYIYFECDVSQGLFSSEAASQYGDYIRMAMEMGYERFDKYPRFLRTYHDIVARNYRIKLNEEEQKQWDEVCEKNSRFKYARNGYKVFTPMKTEELVREGNILGHCVGSYIGRVRTGSCVIAFLRKAEDEDQPLVTVEIVESRIVQARRKMNYPITDEQRVALTGFAKKLDPKIAT